MKISNGKTKSRGFTLIELLVVIAIIGILSSVVLVNVNSARSKARDARRKGELRQFQFALEMYFNNNGSYPSTGGAWYSSEPGDSVTNNGGNYIPGLAPDYIPALPRDPRGGSSLIVPPCSGWKSAYLYESNGSNYKLLSHCSPESAWTSASTLYDPVRPTWAWMVCSGDTTVCSTW